MSAIVIIDEQRLLAILTEKFNAKTSIDFSSFPPMSKADAAKALRLKTTKTINVWINKGKIKADKHDKIPFAEVIRILEAA